MGGRDSAPGRGGGKAGRLGSCFPKLLTHQEAFPKVPHVLQASQGGARLGEDRQESGGLSSAPHPPEGHVPESAEPADWFAWE